LFRRTCGLGVIGWLVVVLLASQSADAEPVLVRYKEGVVHQFLVLRTLDGTAIADGDLIQRASGDFVTARVLFRFRDGSVHEETATFSQRRQFRLLSDRLIQKGPSFPKPIDLSMSRTSGQITMQYTDEGGQTRTESERFDPPADLANGIMLALLKNVRPDGPPQSLSYLVASPKPRLLRLVLAAAGQEPFMTGELARTATHFVLKPQVGGFAGLFASMLGIQPPDAHVWILGGEAPSFLKSEQPFFVGGPTWRIELASPAW
jgi:hypothetical protein